MRRTCGGGLERAGLGRVERLAGIAQGDIPVVGGIPVVADIAKGGTVQGGILAGGIPAVEGILVAEGILAGGIPGAGSTARGGTLVAEGSLVGDRGRAEGGIVAAV